LIVKIAVINNLVTLDVTSLCLAVTVTEVLHVSMQNSWRIWLLHCYRSDLSRLWWRRCRQVLSDSAAASCRWKPWTVSSLAPVAWIIWQSLHSDLRESVTGDVVVAFGSKTASFTLHLYHTRC